MNPDPEQFLQMQQQLEQQQQQLQAQNELIQRQQQQLQQQETQPPVNNDPPNQASPFPREPKLPTPERFNGNRKLYRVFMSQVNTIFTLNPSRFPTDQTRILFIGSLLVSDCAKWFEAVISKTPASSWTYATFLETFEKLFKEPLDEIIARREIQQLRQKTLPATVYATKFMSLSVLTGFNNEALLDLFRQGLNDDIKDVLASSANVPKDLTGFFNHVITVDNRLHERRLEKGSYKPARWSRPAAANYENGGPVPMDLNNVTTRGDHRFQPAPSPRSLTQEEKQRRLVNNLCLYCAQPGHIATNCSARPKNGLQPRRQ